MMERPHPREHFFSQHLHCHHQKMDSYHAFFHTNYMRELQIDAPHLPTTVTIPSSMPHRSFDNFPSNEK